MQYSRKFVGFLLCFCTILAVTLAYAGSTWQKDMDKNLNDKTVTLEGENYTVKGWLYTPQTKKFIVYVKDGNKWLLGYARNPLFPQPAVWVVVAADIILSDGGPPKPDTYVFKDGPRELFKLDPNKLLETFTDMKMMGR